MAPSPDDRWTAALDAVGARTGEPAEAAYRELCERHLSPRRSYHTFQHASAVVDGVLTLIGPGGDWATAVLAGWFHDAVHDPTHGRGLNEGASMVLAVETLTRLRASRHATGEVARLIALTVDHRPDPADATGSVLCDADLAVLGADTAAYNRYTAAMREEYGHLDDQTWRRGRSSFLASLIARPSIFTTDPGIRRWEAPARSNIERELAALAQTESRAESVG